MLRTSMTVAAMLLVGVAVLFATRSAISNEGAAAATPAACPCGQCDAGCQCCLDDDVSCEDCACDKCECEGCDTTATASTKSCCDGKGNCKMTAHAEGAEAMTAAVAAACACGECDADCQCCSDDSVSCEDCSCESCQCTKCDDQVATSA
ncbi:hypothetical protein [Rhodopirellula halodulae]|uniref:hypothetical protein n=1 Tax=Rhodopirellula halodulae TaxID=2894198 RepID=UPI001E3E766D|nr:hypothetical protein [Rhodopirellula sp. JC737]MCC9658050.1 hypothetical protein [Rhodopirellula sp. JC737]